MKPFLKWAGGKSRLVPQIRRRFGGRCKGVYREPFAGSLAVFLARAGMDEIGSAVLSDANEKLMATYIAVRDQTDDVLEELARLPIEPGWEEHYYTIRDTYNEGPAIGPAHAARFIWLNRAGFNGLYRENLQGRFNVPVGRYVRPRIPLAENLHAAADLLTRAELRVMSFEDALATAGPMDQVYCDPPYVPLSRTASFTNYSRGGFGPDAHLLLAQRAADAADRGARLVMSNHATKETRALYRSLGFRVSTVLVQRTISQKANNRWKAKEILAVR